MLDFLHITNGDCAADIIKQLSMGGDVLPWRDTMHDGPFPQGLSLTELAPIRAKYLSNAACLDNAEVARDFTLRDEHLKAAHRYREVILWFEHDLLDQLQIVQLLDWFAGNPFTSTNLSLICINQFDGIVPFRGIGQLSPQQMATLFDQRLPVSQSQLNCAQACWAAYRSPTPQALTEFIKQPDQSLPFLQKAFKRQLQEYPHVHDGLTRSERQLLTLINNGVSIPERVFNQNIDLEDVLYIGDWTSYRYLSELCTNQPSLISCEPTNQFIHPPGHKISYENFNQQRLSLSPEAKAILSGEQNALDLIKRDYWLGGVHIHSDNSLWLWDENQQQFVLYNKE